jgi:sulfhydrogenase subunit gamma (sulfur reductase)
MSEAAAHAPAIVRRVWAETPRLTGVVLEVEADVAGKYVHPGQYVAVHVERADGQKKRVFLVIASAPGEARAFELLAGETAMTDIAFAEGRTINIDPPQGKGFGVEHARGRDVVVFAIGSGLAAVRPVIDTIRKARSEYGRVTAYLGAHTAADFAYAGHFDAWGRDRIDVVRATSRPWVQDLFERDPVPVSNAVAFLCGNKPMIESTTELLVKCGMARDNVRKNF